MMSYLIAILLGFNISNAIADQYIDFITERIALLSEDMPEPNSIYFAPISDFDGEFKLYFNDHPEDSRHYGTRILNDCKEQILISGWYYAKTAFYCNGILNMPYQRRGELWPQTMDRMIIDLSKGKSGYMQFKRHSEMYPFNTTVRFKVLPKNK